MDNNLTIRAELRACLHAVARRMRYFTTDEVWEEADRRGINVERRGADPRVLAPVIQQSSRAGEIEKTGGTRNSRDRTCHGRGKTVWRSLICEVDCEEAEEPSADVLRERLEREEDAIKHEISVRELRRKLSSQRRIIDRLSTRLSAYESTEDLGEQIDGIPKRLKESHTVELRASEPDESTLLVLASDWHVEEVVDPAEVPGNEYNPNIAEERVNNFIRGVLAVRDMSPGTVERLVFAMMGDFITGHIHEELIHTTAMPPLEAMAFAEELLERCLDIFIEEFPEVVVPTCNGNHGRTTQRSYYSRNSDFSLEYQTYVRLARRYKSKATFLVNRSRQNEDLSIYGKRLRFHHGEDCRSSGGDVLAGLRKYHYKQNTKTMDCDMSYVGHWHTASSSFSFGAVNGSLIGNTAYGLQYGAERPQQVYQLLCPTRGVIQTGPIFVE